MKKAGWIILTVAIIALITNLSSKITGFAITSSGKVSLIYNLIFLSFLIASIFMLSYKKQLDAIIIMGSARERQYKDRTKAALERGRDQEGVIYVLTGGMTPDSGNVPAAYYQYKEMRKANIRSVQMKASTTTKDSIDDLLTAIRKVPNATTIGIASNPGHLDRVEKIIDYYKASGQINSDLVIERIETPETIGDKLYEIPARVFTNYRLRNPNSRGIEDFFKNLEAFLRGKKSRKANR